MVLELRERRTIISPLDDTQEVEEDNKEVSLLATILYNKNLNWGESSKGTYLSLAGRFHYPVCLHGSL